MVADPNVPHNGVVCMRTCASGDAASRWRRCWLESPYAVVRADLTQQTSIDLSDRNRAEGWRGIRRRPG